LINVNNTDGTITTCQCAAVQ